MARARIHQSDAERSRAYRQRVKIKRAATNHHENLGELTERLAFVRDQAQAISKESIANWKSPVWGSWEVHCHALQEELDDLVSRLTALIDGDIRPFDGPEFQEWAAKRDGDGRTAEATG
jgi:hypothetical protein